MISARPKRIDPQPPRQGAGRDLDEPPAGPSWSGTLLALLGLAITALFMSGYKPETLARSAAYGVAASLATTFIADFRRGGLRNLVRADVLAIFGLYFLTLFEFLFPHSSVNVLTNVTAMHRAIIACLWGMGGLLVGRHIIAGGHQRLSTLLKRPVPHGWMILIFVVCLLLGHLHMLLAVDFNVIEMLDACMGPRFTQPWGRGRFGDWKALLTELSMLLYIVPPIAGVAFARRRSFSTAQLAMVVLGFSLVMFVGFTSGTRNLFIAYLLTFLIGYAFALPRERRAELIAITTGTALTALIATVLMLEFRSVGLKEWLGGTRLPHAITDDRMHVDMNLVVIGQLVTTFPARHPYLGLEVPYLAIIRPIPRAIWAGKPEGMTVSLEATAGAEEAWTVASSFIGESYMAGGMIAVVLTGLFFGFACNWWSRLASPENSEFGILIFATGFFAAAISMRSLFVFTTALLPTIAAIFGTWLLVKRVTSGLLRSKRPRPMAPPRGGPQKPVRRLRG
ncbi:MAG: O-antigen polymerase [Chthoniobacteraceae bacterium]